MALRPRDRSGSGAGGGPGRGFKVARSKGAPKKEKTEEAEQKRSERSPRPAPRCRQAAEVDPAAPPARRRRPARGEKESHEMPSAERESRPRSRSTRVLLGCLHGRYEGRQRAAGRWRLRTSSQLRRFEQQIERFAPFCCSISKLLSAAHELAPLEATRRSKSIAIGMQQPDITSTNQYCIECIDLS